MVEETKENDGSRKRAEGTFSFGVSAFPSELWKEWNAECQSRYGDCRWIKMWNDHCKARAFDMLYQTFQTAEVVEEVENVVDESAKEKPKQTQEQVIKTFKKEFRQKKEE